MSTHEDLGSEPEAYVLNMDANGLGVARSLGRNGVRVVAVDYKPHNPGMHSRYARPLACPDPVLDPHGCVEALTGDAEAHGHKATIFPTSDEFVLLLYEHRRELARNFLFPAIKEGLAEAIVNKRKLYELAQEAGLETPLALYPGKGCEPPSEGKMRYPAFIKPLYSHLWSRAYRSKGFMTRDQNEMGSILRRIRPSGLEVMVQEYIPGPLENVVSIAVFSGKDGRMSPPYVAKKVRQNPVDNGVGTLVVTSECAEALAKSVVFLRHIQYEGIGELEFKLDPRDGHLKFIELNARPWTQNQLAATGGVNMPLLQYCDLLGLEPPSTGPIASNLRWFDLLSDLSSYGALRERSELSMKDWLRSWARSEVYAYFALDDMRPWVVRMGYGGELAKALVNLIKGPANLYDLPATTSSANRW